ncbi:MAG: hypothetical protein ACRCX2_14930 [Paraclostridium sp.]
MKNLIKNVLAVIGLAWFSFFIAGFLSVILPMTASLGVLIVICIFCILAIITFGGSK